MYWKAGTVSLKPSDYLYRVPGHKDIKGNEIEIVDEIVFIVVVVIVAVC